MHSHGGSETSKGEGWVGGWVGGRGFAACMGVGEGLLHAWVWARVCCMHGCGWAAAERCAIKRLSAQRSRCQY